MNFNKQEKIDMIKNLTHGITIRGKIMAYCIINEHKTIEYRNYKINHKYIALHYTHSRI